MIPKIIHYCWFGGNPLPEIAVKCISSWKKYFPDYPKCKKQFEKGADLKLFEPIPCFLNKKKFNSRSVIDRFLAETDGKLTSQDLPKTGDISILSSSIFDVEKYCLLLLSVSILNSRLINLRIFVRSTLFVSKSKACGLC